MSALRLALAQIDTTVGDIAGNSTAVLDGTRAAAAQGAHLVAFPELTLTGYPPEDLVLRESFQRASRAAVTDLARRLGSEGLGDIAVVIGYVDGVDGVDGVDSVDSVDSGEGVGGVGRSARNSAALLLGGRVVATYDKHFLPNYGVFDEARYFRRGDRFVVVRLHGIDIALTICEDLWQDGGPMAVAGRAGVGLVLTINASPYERTKDDARLDLTARRAREARAAVAYVNAVGGQDELVYDGDSLVVDAAGTLIARAQQFEETMFVVDLDLPAASSEVTGDLLDMRIERYETGTAPVPAYPAERPFVCERLSDEAEIYAALVTGTRDYLRKCGVRDVYLGLSGGIDSALTATIAVDALGPERVHAIALPSRYSSDHSLTDAEDLARRQGIGYDIVPIAPLVAAFDDALALDGLAAENLQARVRGIVLMGLSNQHPQSIVLTTGNKSELATGYSTLYGDSAGGFAPIKDVVKTMVWRLAAWRNSEADKRGETPPIPPNSISKPPSAELSSGQLDSDSLPAYAALDAVLIDYVDNDLGWSELMQRGHDPAVVERVLRLVDRAEYKRRQYPPGPKISARAFGRDRRLPIASRWQETAPHQT
ncbi:MAG: NAD+ synthase [Mycobacteriales bacterium]